MAQPGVGQGQKAAIFLHMILGNEAHGNQFAGPRQSQDDAKFFFGFEDPEGVMSQGPMSNISAHGLGGIKPPVNGQIILGLAAVFTRAELRMIKGMHN